MAKSYLAERAAAEATTSGTPMSSNGRKRADAEDEDAEASEQPKNYGTLSSVLPSFSLTRYSKWRRAQQEIPLPEGVVEPTEWIKNSGPLQIEPKVWLANERTFLKWQHIGILLGSLSIALFTAAGEDFVAEIMGIAYIVIAVFAGLWGRYMLQARREMIVARSGRDFDNMVGPLLVSVALMVALILNFIFAYRAAFDRWNGVPQAKAYNESMEPFFADELL